MKLGRHHSSTQTRRRARSEVKSTRIFLNSFCCAEIPPATATALTMSLEFPLAAAATACVKWSATSHRWDRSIGARAREGKCETDEARIDRRSWRLEVFSLSISRKVVVVTSLRNSFSFSIESKTFNLSTLQNQISIDPTSSYQSTLGSSEAEQVEKEKKKNEMKLTFVLTHFLFLCDVQCCVVAPK